MALLNTSVTLAMRFISVVESDAYQNMNININDLVNWRLLEKLR